MVVLVISHVLWIFTLFLVMAIMSCLHKWTSGIKSDGKALLWNDPSHSNRICLKCKVDLLTHIRNTNLELGIVVENPGPAIDNRIAPG